MCACRSFHIAMHGLGYMMLTHVPGKSTALKSCPVHDNSLAICSMTCV